MSDDEKLAKARAAVAKSRANLETARHRRGIVDRLSSGLGSILEDNHFSIRIARDFGLEDK